MNERRTIDRIPLDFRRQRGRTDHIGFITLGRVDNLAAHVIDQLMIVRLDLDSHFVFFNVFFCHIEQQPRR